MRVSIDCQFSVSTYTTLYGSLRIVDTHVRYASDQTRCLKLSDSKVFNRDRRQKGRQ